MAQFRVIAEREAERNIAAIYNWIAAQSVEGAVRRHRLLEKTIESIAVDPQRFAIAPESRQFEENVLNATFRMRSRRVYRLLFTIEGENVRLLFVRGPGQDWVAR
jgi:plasmid stabilization system protein ParE